MAEVQVKEVPAAAAVIVTTEKSDIPMDGQWFHPLCGCCSNCCPGGLVWFLFLSNLAWVTCIPCIVGQIAARADLKPNFIGKHSPGCCCQSNCKQGWLMTFLLALLPGAIMGILYLMAYITAAAVIAAGFASGYSLFQIIPYVLGAGGATLGYGGIANTVYVIFWALGLAFYTNLRSQIRTRYSIPGSCCCDCLIMWWCYPCAINQMYSHVYADAPCNICADPGPAGGGAAAVEFTEMNQQ